MAVIDQERKTYLSITTVIGCPVMCLKYCPQELIIRSYNGNPRMTLEQFKQFIKDVPITTSLYFGGFSEPLVNQETIAMMEYASELGYPIRLFTTMVGLKHNDIDRLCSIPFDMFVLHLQDAEGIAHIDMNQEWLENFRDVKKRIKRFRSMDMNSVDFSTNHREDVARGVEFQSRFKTKRTCVFMKDPRYELMPNGEMYFCCECSCLSMRIGSLYKNTYTDLAAKHEMLSKQFRNDPNSLCWNCCLSEPYWKYQLSNTMRNIKYNITNGKPIKETRLIKPFWDVLFTSTTHG